MDKVYVGCLLLLGWIVLVLVCGALGAAVFMLLWNWIMPYLFGLPEISLWLAWGIIILIGILIRIVCVNIKATV